MKERRESISTILGRLTWISIGVGVLYWIVETAIDAWGFHSGDFIGRLFAPPYALIRRLLILGTFTALGVYLQVLIAGRRRAEQAIQREHDITQKYLQIVGTIIVALDADGRITLMNRKACEVLGYEEHELLGKDWFATCLPQRVRGEARAIFDRLIAGEIEPVEYFENPILTRSGEERLVSWHNSMLTDEAGHVIGALSSGEDVTERRQAEALLRESEEKYRNLVERANDGIIIVQDGLIKYLNRRLADMLGSTVEEMVDTSFFDYIHPENRAQVMTRYEQRLAGQDVPPVYEVMLLRKDGGSLYAELNAGVITYQGRPADLVIVRDITERKRAEKALEESEVRFRKQFEEALDAIFVADAETGILIDCNRAACELVGREKSELVGQHQRILHPAEEIEGEFSRAFREHQKRAEHLLETQVITKEGQIRDVAIKANLFEIGGRKVLQGIFRDVTERKRAERALEQRAAQLALLNDIGRQIAAVTDLNTVLERAARLVQERFGYHHAALFTLDRETGELVMRARAGKFAHLFPLDHRLKLGQGIVGWVGGHGETLLANDVDAEPRYVNLYPDLIPTKAELSVPIRVGREVVGVLDVQSDRSNAFGENDVRVMETLADQIAVAVENARLYEALRESEERFRRLAENAQDLIYRYEFVPQRRFAYVSPAATAITGYTPEEHYADPDLGFKLVHPDDRHLLESLAKGERLSGEPIVLRWVHKNGTIFWTEQRNVGIYDESGNLVAIEGIARDVTERKRAEEALAQRAAQLALLNDIGRQIAAVTDLNTVLERAARLVQERFGYHHAALFTLDRETGELVMRARAGKFAHLFPLDHRLKLGQGMVGWVGSHGETLLANDVDTEPRYVNLYPDLIPTKAELSVPIRVGREVVGVLDVQSDRSNAFGENDVRVMETLADQIAVAIENARLYEQVRAGEESERRFRERLAALHELSIELSKAPTFDDLCRQAVELGCSRLGFDRLGIWFLDKDPQFMVGSFGTDEQGRVRDERGRRLAFGPESADALVFSGRVPLVFEPDTLLRDDKGAVVGRGWEAVAAMRDADRVIGHISTDNLLRGLPADEHQLEILKLYGVTLGHLCTRKRAEEALAQKAQELARSNADLEHFAYVASHDLQEPLRMVSSYLQLLERRYKEQLDADAREFIAYAVDGATRMQNLINALLSYSRVGTRGKPFEPTDCSVVLERALLNLKVAIEETNATITHDPLPTVVADGVQLTQVFQNLIGNAIKFHGERRPEVHVGAQRGKGEWVLSVRDNGIGIDPQHFERIFMIFQRLHSREEYPGTGIGLAICKRIIERHGGRIWVESQPGEGSTFYFTIPDRGGAP